MAELPYDVNEWVSTEGFVAKLVKSSSDFAPSSHDVVHLVDILGRLIPMRLTEEIMKCRDRRLEVMVVRMHIQRLLGESDRGPVSERIQWACILLMGSY